jgi:hypothetical protein
MEGLGKCILVVVANSLFTGTAAIGNCAVVQGVRNVFFGTIDWSLAA